ncbi:MAG: hypothetical protein ACLPY1_13525 [Terracidiphilus sp.]
MRIAIFALFLSTGTAAFCQSPAPAPLQPNQAWVFPPGTVQPGGDLSTLSPEFHFSFVPKQKVIVPPKLGLFDKNRAKIDPNIVVHPPKSSIGEQAPGTLVAQNLYPGLQLLPIDGPKAKVQPIPITWPKMKMENIPTTCPDCKMVLVESGTAAQAARK